MKLPKKSAQEIRQMLTIFAKSRLHSAGWLTHFPGEKHTEGIDIQFNNDGLAKVQHLRSLLEELGFPEFGANDFNALHTLLSFIRPLKPGENAIILPPDQERGA